MSPESTTFSLDRPASPRYSSGMTVAAPEPATSELTPAQLAHAQASFVAALPRIERHARTHFGWIRDPGRRDDQIANSLGRGWQHWLQCIRDGKDPSTFVSAIADYAVKATRSHRRVDRQESPNDVLSPRAQRTRGFTTQTLPDVESGVDDNKTIDALTDNTRTPPPQQAAFREQFGMMLDEIGPRDAAVVQDLAAGDTTTEVAAKHKFSLGRGSQIRRKAEDTWNRIDRGDDRGR